ncbi:MAG: porin [Henriciella sp.]
MMFIRYLIIALVFVMPAAAEPLNPVRIRLNSELVLVAPLASDDTGAARTEGPLGEIGLSARIEKLLDNGLRLRGYGALRLQKDHPQRPGGAGAFGSAIAGTNSIPGAFSGFSDGPALTSDSLRGRVETAFFQIDGGYGEVRFGKDRGVAARFYEGTPTVLDFARLDTPLLDPSGLGVIISRHDLTGPSPKISYASPRILGVRAGLSYTPIVSADGLDRRTGIAADNDDEKIRHAAEFALNSRHLLRQADLRIETALAWSRGTRKDTQLSDAESDIDTFSAGALINWSDILIGASWLDSNNGRRDSAYEAWSAGIETAWQGLDWSLEHGRANDKGIGLISESWRLASAWRPNRDVKLALALTNEDLNKFDYSASSTGLVFEITLSKKILNLDGN